MKTLVLLVVVGVCGFFAYEEWFSAPPPAESPPAEVAAPEPVEFAVKVRVRRMIEEWKNRSAGSARRPSMTDIESEVNDIRRRLHDKGLHDEKSLKELMTRAAVELGHTPDQARILIGKILAGGQRTVRPAQSFGGVVSDVPEPPASRMRSVGGGN